MGFQLVIAEGKEAGREFVFDQQSVVIGRTSECDVVLYDPGVSRKHARIFAEGEGWYVEDMGSSNGTKVNGSIIKKKQLSDGDAVALGPVVFNFAATYLEEPEPSGNGVAGQSTRIVSAGDVKPRQKNKGVALVPTGAQPDQLQQMARTATRAMGAVSKTRAQTNAGLQRREESPPEDSQGAIERPVRRGPLSAAEKARIRRESGGLLAMIKIFWAEASNAARMVVYGFAGLVGLGLVAVLYYLVIVPSDDRPKLPPEPARLEGRKPVEFSFGYGDGVQYERADKKLFSFEYAVPTRAVVIVHFQAKDVSQGEVMVSVNGAEIGPVPADTLSVNERSNEIIVPPSVLKKGEVNQLEFDNLHNPPKSDPWRIWNVWVEVNPIPELSAEELRNQAKNVFERGMSTYERKDIGAANRYEAWKDFRTSWLMLEGHPEPKPELYQMSRDKVRESQQELDRTCAKLLLEAGQYYNLNQFKEAKDTLDHIKEYFPGNDQPCPWRAEQKRYEWNL